MTATLANKIKPTGTPIFCSACHGQYPERAHVDFDAACDRGYGTLMVQGNSKGDVIDERQIEMDDLILCEECLRDGAKHIGMIDGEEWREERAAMAERLSEETQRVLQLEHELQVTDSALARFIEPAKARKAHEDAVKRGKASAKAQGRKVQ